MNQSKISKAIDSAEKEIKEVGKTLDKIDKRVDKEVVVLKAGDHIVFNNQKGTVGIFRRPGSLFRIFGGTNQDCEFFIGRKVTGDINLAGNIAMLIAKTHGLSSGVEKNDLPDRIFFKFV